MFFEAYSYFPVFTIKMPEAKIDTSGMMGDLVTRLVKYVIEGLAVAVVAYVLPGKLKISEIGMISLVAMATFAILDMYAPSVGASARTGAGFGIGAGLVGFPA
jgi:hypothetical protein